MKYIGLLSSDARGKVGGNVASRNRYGTYMRAHVSPVQPRTPRQQANRQTFGSLSSQWRAQSAAQQAGWQTLASTVVFRDQLGQTYNPSGAQLFLMLARILTQQNGATTIPSLPQALPSLPSIESISPSITVASGAVTAISVAMNPGPPIGNTYFIYASKVVGLGVNFIAPSLFRYLTNVNDNSANPVQLLTEYTTVFGAPATTGKIGFKFRVVDAITGYYGSDILAIATI